MTHYACPKCKYGFDLPASASPPALAKVASVARASRIEGAKSAREDFDLDLATAKGLVTHITLEKGRCHRCRNPLTAEISICENCHSLNLDW